MKNYAVIFDVDGVLVDSYDAHFQSWQQLALRYDRVCTEADFAAGFGRTSREVLQMQWSDANLSDEQIEQLDLEKEAIYREIVDQNFPVMPGAIELINQLTDQGIPFAMGSSGPPENTVLAAEKLGVAKTLSAMVTGADVQFGKPHPEVFLTAAAKMNLPSERCLVIEDAPAGIEAAKRAGMFCVGFASRGRTAEDIQQADLKITALKELSIEKICNAIDGLN